MSKVSRIRSIACVCVAALWVLAGCGGGGGGSAGASSNGSRGGGTFAVGGSVTGLGASEAVTLVNNAGDTVAVTANGPFTFASGVPSGGNYAVTVQSHTPGIACSISNGSGTVGTAAVTGIAVTCGAGTLQLLHTFDASQGSVDGQSPSSTLVADSNGNFYGTTQGGGNAACACGTVFKIQPSGAYSVLHNFAGGPGDGDMPMAGVVVDSSGNLYGTTYAGGVFGFGTVFKISPNTGLLWSHSLDDSLGEGRNPIGGLVIDANGDLYGTASGGGAGYGTVFKVNAQTGSVIPKYAFGLQGVGDGKYPNGTLIIDGSGNLYGTTAGSSAFPGTSTIFKLTPFGSQEWSYVLGSRQDDGQIPTGALVMDSAGNLYGTTSAGGHFTNGTVFKVTSAGVHSVLYSFNSADGDGMTPYAELVLDGYGSLYGTTSSGDPQSAAKFGTVFKITSSGVFKVLYAFKGGADDGAAPNGGLLLDSVGNIYATTYGDNRNTFGSVFKLD